MANKYAEWGVPESEFGISEWGGRQKTAGRYNPRLDRDGRRRPTTPYATKLPGFPKPPADISVNLRQYLTNITEALEVRLGRRGDPRDAAVTFRDLGDVIPVVGTYIGGGGSSSGGSNPGGGDPPGEPGVDDPTAPTGFRVVAAIYNMTLFWDAGELAYGGHGYTEIRRAPAFLLEDGTEDPNKQPTLEGETTIQVGTALGTSFVVATGPSRIYYYWIRFVNRNGVKGPWAFPYPEGLRGETSPDPDIIIDALDDILLESAVIIALQDEIDLLVKADEGLQQEIDQLASLIGDGNGDVDLSVILQRLAQVEASVDGLEAQYTIKIQSENRNGKYIVGFGLSSDLPTDAGNGTSTFAVAAQNFAIIEPTWYPNDADLDDFDFEPYIPFSVTTEEQVDPETGITIPAGVYIKDAFISEATVVKLIAGNIIADYITAGVYLQTPQLFSSSINMGTLVTKDNDDNDLPIKDWYVTDDDVRKGNFSVSQDGIMHARAAHLYAATIYDEANNEIIFDVNGISGTYIKDATITTAKIETAAIKTLLLDGDAVTIPRGFAGGDVVLEGSGAQALLGTVTLSYVPFMEDVTGTKVDIRPKAVIINAHVTAYSGTSSTTGTFFLDVDGVSVEASQISNMTTTQTLMFTYLDTPPEDLSSSLVNRTYKLYMRKENQGKIEIYRYGLTLMGGKR